MLSHFFFTKGIFFKILNRSKPKLKKINKLFSIVYKIKTETQYQTTMHVNNPNCAEDELKKSAGEILNGIKRTVEVQVVNPSTFNFQDQTILGTSLLYFTLCAHKNSFTFVILFEFPYLSIQLLLLHSTYTI